MISQETSDIFNSIPSSPPQGSRNVSRRNSVNFNTKSSNVSEVLASNDGPSESEGYNIEYIRIELKKALTNSLFGIYYENLLAVISVVSCLEYIYHTYMDDGRHTDEDHILYYFEMGFAGLFLLDWFFNLFLADQAASYFVR